MRPPRISLIKIRHWRFFLCTSIILDPSVDGSSYTYSAENATWSLTFSNNTNGGTISGISSCNSLTGTWGQAYPEYNNQITQGYQDGGLQCWCRMTSPVRSAWVRYSVSNSASDCTTSCANNCAYNVSNSVDFRRAMFNTAGN